MVIGDWYYAHKRIGKVDNILFYIQKIAVVNVYVYGGLNFISTGILKM